MSKFNIPFNKPTHLGIELAFIEKAIENGHISGDGEFTKKCQSLLEDELGVVKVLLTTSCTHALEMATLLLDIHPDDEVIVPSFTFVTTINSFVLRGAKPVFTDIREDTLNIDERSVEHLINSRTKAIVPVHYAGVGCEMDALMELAEVNAVSIVEDNAHGLFGKYKGKYLGTFGQLATQSFHETKNFTCGEGGALLINNPQLIERAEIIREKGTDRSKFFRGQVDKYTWVDLGSSYLPSDLLAAMLFVQLQEREKIQSRRRELWTRYKQALGEWAEENDVRMPFVPASSEQTYHMFFLILPTLESRTRFIQYLKDAGILSVFHYIPLHLSPMGQRMGYKEGDFPITESISNRLVRLPLFYNLHIDEQDEVIGRIMEFHA